MSQEQLQIRRERAAAWNRANRDRRKQTMRLYYERNGDAIKAKASEYAAAYRSENKDKLRAGMQQWRKQYPWYNIWQTARQRCTNPKHPRFHRYGGRGIQFMLSKTDMAFLWARDRASELFEPSIDRKDNDGPYSLDNCQFIELRMNSSKKGRKVIG